MYTIDVIIIGIKGLPINFAILRLSLQKTKHVDFLPSILNNQAFHLTGIVAVSPSQW
jgi:hypothetical protein